MARPGIELRVVKAPGRDGWCLAWQMAAIWIYETACGNHVTLGAGTEVADIIPQNGVLCENCRRAIQRTTGVQFAGDKPRRKPRDARDRDRSKTKP